MAKLPWWPFYGRNFFGDERVKLMSNAQIGMYVKLLDHQWNEGSIPASIGYSAFMDLRHLRHDPKVAEEEFAEVMRECFVAHPTLPSRMYNLKMEEIRTEQLRKEKENQERARRASRAASRKRQGDLAGVHHGDHHGQAKETSLEPIQIQNQNQIQKQTKKKKKSDAHPIPENWALSQEMIAYAKSKGMTQDTFTHEFEHCKEHHQEARFTIRGWSGQVWRTWVLNWISFGRKQVPVKDSTIPRSFRQLETSTVKGEPMPGEVRDLMLRVGRGKAMPA